MRRGTWKAVAQSIVSLFVWRSIHNYPYFFDASSGSIYGLLIKNSGSTISRATKVF